MIESRDPQSQLGRFSQSGNASPSTFPQSTQNPALGDPTAQGNSDLVQVLWRWKWLPIFGAIFGAIGGLLQFRTVPPTYISSALLQVAYPITETGGPQMNSNDTIRGYSRLDESMIIKSDTVIRKAAQQIVNNPRKDEKFNNLGTLQGKSIDEVVGIINSRNLIVEPAGRDNTTSLLNVSFLSTDAVASDVIVTGLIEGYKSYLGDAYSSWGKELLSVVESAQTNLQTKYEKLSQDQINFRRKAPGIWNGDEIRDPHAEECLEIKSEITSIQIDKTKIRSTLEHIEKAKVAKRSPDAILAMLRETNEQKNKAVPGSPLQSPTDNGAATLMASNEQKQTELEQLKMRESELLDTLGESHPSVAAVRRRVKLMETNLAKSEENAKVLQSELKAIPKDESESSGKQLQLWIDSLQEHLATLELQEKQLVSLASEAEMRSKELQAIIAESKVLNSEMSAVEDLRQGYIATLSRLQTLPKGSQTTLQVLTPSKRGSFNGPRLSPYLLGGGFLGFACLAALAFVLDWSEKSYRDPDEISAQLGYPILGHIPMMPQQRASGALPFDASLITAQNTRSAASEAYRSVRTGLYFRENAERIRVLQVTSPIPGDGKSTLSANLAITIAQSGRSVLLIDADFRRPRLASLFGIVSKVGTADIISGGAQLRDAIVNTPVPNLSVLPSGKPPANPAELLSSSRFAALIATLREKFDYVIIDTPPLLAVSDPCIVAAIADGVILNLRLRRNVRPLAASAAKLLQSVNASTLGVVVNGVGKQRHYGYHHNRYSAYYGEQHDHDDSASGHDSTVMRNDEDTVRELSPKRIVETGPASSKA